jgi:hypothetical protein
MIRKLSNLSLVAGLLSTGGLALGQDAGSSLPSAAMPVPQAAPMVQAPAPFTAPSTPMPGPSAGTPGPATPSQPYVAPAQAQIPPQPPAPPYVPYQPGVPAPYVPNQPAPLPLPYNPYPDPNGVLLRGDPLYERPAAAQPGLYFGLELEILAPHIRNGLNANVAATGFEPNVVALGGAPLDWTGSPKFNLGYRFAEGLGSVDVSYRFVVSDGTEILQGFDLDGSDAPLKSRLDMNIVDIDYVSREISLGHVCDLQWRVGARLASVFFDSQAEGFFLAQQTSNSFFGAGPHVGLDLGHRLGNSEFGLFGRIDTSVPIGQVRQSFSEVFVTSDGTVVGGATDVHQTQAVPTLGIQFGLSWTPCWRGRQARYTFGYAFEEWWDVGQAGSSRADLTTQGFFLRGEFNF